MTFIYVDTPALENNIISLCPQPGIAQFGNCQTYSMAMVKVKCPFPDCTFEAENDEAVVIAALLNIHATAHTATAIAPSTSARADKLKRPSVLLAGTGEEWAYVVTRWNEYREGTKLTGADVVAQLLECCDDDLRRDLTRAAGGTLTGKGEAEVLASIKTLVFRQENIMVARATLHNMRQDRYEAIRSLGARIKGQAGICKYTTTCPRDDCNADIDYTDAILRDVLARSIADEEIQLDLLGDQNQSMSLEDMLRFVEAKESGKRSASRLLDPTNVSAASSTYRRAKQPDRGKQPDIREKTPAAYVRIAEARAMAAMHHSTSEGTNAEPTTIYVHTVANETTLKMSASVKVKVKVVP